MRWKLLWLITTLTATAQIEGIKNTKGVEQNQEDISQTQVYNAEISISNTSSDVTEASVNVNANNNKSDATNQTEGVDLNREDFITKTIRPDGSVNNVVTSSVTGLLRTAAENITSIGTDDDKNYERHQRDATEKTGQKNKENNDQEPIIIETDLGKVRGYPWPDSDEIISYYDIPYGEFSAFEEPVTPENKWELLSNTAHTKKCPQIKENEFTGSTDCLTLSIFTPKSSTNAAVLFYIHEGSSNVGSGDPLLYGPEYLVTKGIILVLPNFRLGALGFLCLQNSTAPGNAAVKDLALALKWIKNNIKAFGGDPSNIVISGDGTSGALAGYLALSSNSKEHISKVITESGAVLSYWAIDRDPIKTATQLAEHLRNETNNSVDDKSIFSDTSIEDLVRITNSFSFKPCIEENSNGTITKNPWTILNNEATNISFMIGSANHAALPMALQYDSGALSQLNEDFMRALPNDLAFPNDNTRRDIERRIKEQYFGSNDITSDATRNLSLYFTDVSYLGPDVRLARALVATGATVYLYEFSYVGKLNNGLEAIDIEQHHGAVRGDIVGYLFSQVGRKPEETSEEEKVIEMMTELWVSFIKDGRPTAGNVIWAEFNATDDTLESWLSIDKEASPQAGYHQDRLRLWTEVYRDFFADNNASVIMKTNGYIYYAIALFFIKTSKNAFI